MTRTLLALALFTPGAVAAAADKPNVVFLLADDLGAGDLACTGHPYAKTPTLDRLAADGTLFRHFYCGGSTCCPTRTALMTGRPPASFAKNPAAFGFGDTPTVSGLLKTAGYRTGHFGKWHIGDVQKPGTYGLDRIQVLGGNRRDPRGRDAQIADATIDFMRANKAGPFFVNVWFHTVHNPVNPPQAFVDQFRDVVARPADFANPDMAARLTGYAKDGDDVPAEMRKHLGDVLQLDGQVARILKSIDDLGLRRDTLVVFTSDNGPNRYGSAGPYRGAKHSHYDGGIHQPLIVRWPGRVPAGRVDDRAVLAAVDWLPTLAALAGVPVAPDEFPGEDVSDLWRGGRRARRTDLFFRIASSTATPIIRRGDWKLHLPPRRGGPELYDLTADPGERTNLAARRPEVVKELSATLKKWTATLPASYTKGNDKDD